MRPQIRRPYSGFLLLSRRLGHLPELVECVTFVRWVHSEDHSIGAMTGLATVEPMWLVIRNLEHLGR